MKVSAKLVANFRRSLEDYFRASFAGKIVRSMFHRKFHHQLHYEVLGGGGPYELNPSFLRNALPERGFEAIRANRSHVMKIGVLCESITRSDSREWPPFALRITGPSKHVQKVNR